MIEGKNKSVLIFDLDDTLSQSKQPLDTEMAGIINKLIDSGYILAVTSGGSYEQFQSQFLSNLDLTDTQKEKLYILPTSGASMYRFLDGKWKEVYSFPFPNNEKNRIIDLLTHAIKEQALWTNDSFGNLIEDRGTQISYSGLGQDAPLEMKKNWDPNQTKRKLIVGSIKSELSDYEIKIGGRTTIDITKKGISKGYGIKQLSNVLSIPVNKMLYFGDALFSGGNDESALESGIESIEVKDFEDTKKILKTEFLKD